MSESPKTYFDLNDADGLNESERILSRLCKKSFLKPWAYSNVFTDEGHRNGKGNTKELCDALVIFGDDVLVFSDKCSAYQVHKDTALAWQRWYNRTVIDSYPQLFGAASWIRQFPWRAFLDPKCTRKLPVQLPAGENVRIHLIVVTRGSKEACKAYWGEEKSHGTLRLNTLIRGDEQHIKNPFVVGHPAPDKGFIHVFDEVGIELLLEELDTARDFIDYLKAREQLLHLPKCDVSAAGEEQLMAAYIRSTAVRGIPSFLSPAAENEGYDYKVFAGEFYAGLANSPEYKQKKADDEISYRWDDLISRFVQLSDPELGLPDLKTGSIDAEISFRYLAAESRFRRRLLSETLWGAIETAAEEGYRRFARMIGGEPEERLPAYIFVLMPKLDGESENDYRDRRRAYLLAYCRVARLHSPDDTVFIGIGMDHPCKPYTGGSLDLAVFESEAWNETTIADAKKLAEEFGLWGPNARFWGRHATEYTYSRDEVTSSTSDVSAARKKRNAQETKRKRVKKMKSKSQKRNRN
ncbi:MAG TPA: hypothetical protein VF472_24110 [Burkholderiaceae bacterium]